MKGLDHFQRLGQGGLMGEAPLVALTSLEVGYSKIENRLRWALDGMTLSAFGLVSVNAFQ